MLSNYMSVSRALEYLTTHGTILGSVRNHPLAATDAKAYPKLCCTSGRHGNPPQQPLWAMELGCKMGELQSMDGKFAVRGTANISGPIGVPSGRTCASTSPPSIQMHHVLSIGEKKWSLLDGAVPVTEIIECCTPAAYGDLLSQTTKYDTSVRQAWECQAVGYGALAPLPRRDTSDDSEEEETTKTAAAVPLADPTKPAERFSLNTIIGGEGAAVRPRLVPFLVASIAEDLRSLFKQPIHAVPCKLNVYEAGGFFQPHVDTPVFDTARMLGTLVIEIPTNEGFTGGELFVWPPGIVPNPSAAPGPERAMDDAEAVLIDWSARLEASVDEKSGITSKKVNWAAFYGDCVHAVRPVTSGSRITVTYAILAARMESEALRLPFEALDSSACESLHTPTSRDAIVQHHISSILKDVRAVVASRGGCGLMLTHKYTMTGMHAGVLKGMDIDLWQAFNRDAGFDVKLQSVVYNPSHTGAESDDNESTYTNHVYAMGEEHLDFLRKCDPDGKASLKEISRLPFIMCQTRAYPELFPGSEFAEDLAHVKSDDLPGMTLMRHKHQNYVEHTGNECLAESDDALYFSACILVSAAVPKV